MRYDDWDVILFPRDSHVPIQEFKTACYNAQDSKGQQLPTVTCYICSLPPSTPFRISVHSWAATSRPSAIIEAQRKANQKIVYRIQVVVDGARVFHGCFEVASRWPQEIAQERRILAFLDQPTSQRKPYLEFPQFFQHTLMQAAWESKDTNGRINIVLSEQLVCKSDKVGDLDLGIANDIVCFSFQHAPKDILEQAGISWPIRNPLYLPDVRGRNSTPSNVTEPSLRAAKVRHATEDADMRSPFSHASSSNFVHSRNPELLQRPDSHPPPLSHFPKAPPGARNRMHPDIWEDSFRSYRDNHDDISQSSWSTQRSTSNSNSIGDMFMSDYLPTSSRSFKTAMPSANPSTRYQESTQSSGTDQRTRRDLDRQVILSLRDDQLGQIIQAISPPRRLPHGINNQSNEQLRRPPSVHAYHPPKLGTTTLTGRPSAAALARKSSYPDFNDATRITLCNESPDALYATRHHKSKVTSTSHPSGSSNKENCSPSQSRLPTPFPYANRVPTPNPFNPRYWNSDGSMRDGSSVFSSFNRHNESDAQGLSEAYNKHGVAHPPSATGGVRSRKEGLVNDPSHLPGQAVRHDQSMLPPASVKHKSVAQEATGTSRTTPSVPEKEAATVIEIIDVDAIDTSLSPAAPLDTTKLSPFKPNHKSGMSSIDSTGRFEQNLFSALGEELASFESHGDRTKVGHELLNCAAAVGDDGEDTVLGAGTGELEPIGKRKRQGTLGGERDSSPASKKEKGSGANGEDGEHQAL